VGIFLSCLLLANAAQVNEPAGTLLLQSVSVALFVSGLMPTIHAQTHKLEDVQQLCTPCNPQRTPVFMKDKISAWSHAIGCSPFTILVPSTGIPLLALKTWLKFKYPWWLFWCCFLSWWLLYFLDTSIY
jgi:hypothetical protein